MNHHSFEVIDLGYESPDEPATATPIQAMGWAGWLLVILTGGASLAVAAFFVANWTELSRHFPAIFGA